MTNNQSSTVESFISWCDEMMIAEESAASMNKEFEKEKKRIDQIHDEIRNCQDVKKQITLYKELSSILKELYSKVNAMEPSMFDKAVKYGATILSTIAPIAATVSTNILFRKLQNATDEKIPGKNIGSLVIGAATRCKVNKLTYKAQHPDYSKKNILEKIKSMEHVVDNCITVLSNPKYKNMVNSVQRDKNYSNKLSSVKSDYEWEKNQKQLCLQIVNDVKKCASKVISKYNLTSKVSVTVYDKIRTSSKNAKGYSVDVVNKDSLNDKEWNTYDDMLSEISDSVSSVYSKYKAKLNTNNCEMVDYVHDDYFRAEIRTK